MRKILFLLTIFNLCTVCLFAEISETKKHSNNDCYTSFVNLPSEINNILLESKSKQLNGIFSTSKGLYGKLIFIGRNSAVIDSGLVRTETTYFIFKNIVVIKLDKGGFFELEMQGNGTLKGLDSHTKDCIYTRTNKPEKKISPFILNEAERRILLGNLYFYAANSYAKNSRDIQKIFKLYNIGAKKGSPDCANKCGIMLLYRNKGKAIMYFNHAAKLGSGNAYYNLANIYKNDKKKYKIFLQKAADLNCKEAKIDLVMLDFE